jgi:hypothetical protein
MFWVGLFLMFVVGKFLMTFSPVAFFAFCVICPVIAHAVKVYQEIKEIQEEKASK